MDIQLPDFEDMFSLAKEIGGLTLEKMLLENEIALQESNATKWAFGNVKLNNKSPSMEYIKTTYKYTGIENETISLRIDLAKVVSRLEELRLRFEIMQSMISLYQTETKNKRSMVVM